VREQRSPKEVAKCLIGLEHGSLLKFMRRRMVAESDGLGPPPAERWRAVVVGWTLSLIRRRPLARQQPIKAKPVAIGESGKVLMLDPAEPS
jgi:hypothetical protein